MDEVDSVGDDLGLAAAVQPLLLVGRRRARGQDQREGAQERAKEGKEEEEEEVG